MDRTPTVLVWALESLSPTVGSLAEQLSVIFLAGNKTGLILTLPLKTALPCSLRVEDDRDFDLSCSWRFWLGDSAGN